MLLELNLAEFDAAAYGVSRAHAVLRLTGQGIALVDLDSTNGTYLNNYRLAPHVAYLLTNGDEVSFGDLLVHVFF
jgi:pSer/pThr/pTyr-binding forkhead associated (FHA) protein